MHLVTLSTEWVPEGFGLNVQRGIYSTCTVSGTCGARTTPIPSQRARVSSVGEKTPSFSFCQVDMYACDEFEQVVSDNIVISTAGVVCD